VPVRRKSSRRVRRFGGGALGIAEGRPQKLAWTINADLSADALNGRRRNCRCRIDPAVLTNILPPSAQLSIRDTLVALGPGIERFECREIQELRSGYAKKMRASPVQSL
jgi:hypothetical protein